MIRLQRTSLAVAIAAIAVVSAGCAPKKDVTSRRTSNAGRATPEEAREDRDLREIVRWNSLARYAATAESLDAALAANLFATVHVAMRDAASAAGLHDSEPYLPYLHFDSDTIPALAAAAAADRVISELSPSLASLSAVALDEAASAYADVRLATIDLSFVSGRSVAEDVLSQRSANREYESRGVSTSEAREPAPGIWTPNLAAQASVPWRWGLAETWTSANVEQFNPPPPAVSSTNYASELAEVMRLGSKERTPSGKETAEYKAWTGDGSETIAAKWNEIALNLSDHCHFGFAERVRILALVNVAMADAGIAAYEAKANYSRWRPSSGAAFIGAKWSAAHDDDLSPSYPSDGAFLSGAASEVLAKVLGRDAQEIRIADHGDETTYESLSLASEAFGDVEIRSGAHFPSDVALGLSAGRRLGRLVVRGFFRRLQGATDEEVCSQIP